MAEAVQPVRERSLIALDLARFACAMLVVAFHLSGFSGQSDAPIVGAGWIGVELFFVLSGVVIAWSAEGSTPHAFAARRALRLLPTAWLCASLTAAVLLAAGRAGPAEVGARWLASALFDPVGTAIDPSYWTLAIEVHFYLLVALTLRGGGSIERIERMAIGLGCASAIYWAATLIGDVLPVQNRFAQLTLLPHGCLFALGVLLRVRARSGLTRVRGAAMLLFGGASVLEIVAHAREFPGGSPMVAAATLIFAGGLTVIATADHWQPRLERHVPRSVAGGLAALTYPLYLLHQEIGRASAAWLAALGAPTSVTLAVTLAIAVGLAWLVARHLEPALRRGLLAGLSRSRGRAPDSLPSASPSAG